MSSEPTEQDEPGVPDSADKTKVVATDLYVGEAGRLTIPEEKRDRYDIQQGDYIDAILFLDGDEPGDSE
jgi:hypothetical protein